MVVHVLSVGPNTGPLTQGGSLFLVTYFVIKLKVEESFLPDKKTKDVTVKTVILTQQSME